MSESGFGIFLTHIGLLGVLLLVFGVAAEEGHLGYLPDGLHVHHLDVLGVQLVFLALGLEQDIFFCHR